MQGSLFNFEKAANGHFVDRNSRFEFITRVKAPILESRMSREILGSRTWYEEFGLPHQLLVFYRIKMTFGGRCLSY